MTLRLVFQKAVVDKSGSSSGEDSDADSDQSSGSNGTPAATQENPRTVRDIVGIFDIGSDMCQGFFEVVVVHLVHL